MVAMAIMGVGAVTLISGGAQQVRDEYQSEQAFQVAQAGRADVADVLKNDADWSDNADYSKTMSPGAFTVTFTAKSLNAATVRVSGAVGTITRQIEQNFSRAGISAWQHGIYTEQDVSAGGSASGDIYGPISAGGSIGTSGGVTFHDPTDPNNTNAQLPTPDWVYWQGVATYVGSNPFPSSSTYTGIFYDTNSGNIPNNTTINGTLITRGGLTLNSKANITITPAAGNPAMIIDGDLRINGCANLSINGWVIVLGDIDLLGNSDVTADGGFAATGDISLGGTTDIQLTYNPALAPSSGAGFTGGEISGGGEGQYIVFGTWKEIF